MTIYLFMLVCVDGGNYLCEDRQHEMPTWELCFEAVNGANYAIDVKAGDKEDDHVAFAFYCGTKEVVGGK